MEQANNATRFMLSNNPARYWERANIVPSLVSPPPPQPKRRPRSRLFHFTASSSPALWQLPSGKASWLRHHARAAEVFCPIRRRHSPRRVSRRNGSRLFIAVRLLLPGDGIGSLQLRLQTFTLRFAPDHFFRLRFRSPMPGE